MATYITDADLTDYLEAVHQLATGGTLEAFATAIIAAANESAYRAVQSALIKRGFSQAQIDVWDRRVEFNRDIAVYQYFVRTGVWARMQSDGREDFEWLDREAELDSVVVTENDVKLAPANFSKIEVADIDTSDNEFDLLDEGIAL